MQDSSEKRRGAGELLSESEVQRLLLAASHRSASGVRNRALIALLYCSGVRLGEALRLRPADLDLERCALRVQADGSRRQEPQERRAHLFPAARPYLETWLALRERLELGEERALFCTLAGGPLEPAYVRAFLSRLARRAGIAGRVHAHGLRHSFAARLAAEGAGAALLAQALGHADPRTSARALARRGIGLAPSGGPRALAGIRWTLGPEIATTRIVIDWRERNPPGEPPPAGNRVIVRPAHFAPL